MISAALIACLLAQPAPPGWTPIDPATADADPLAASSRLLPADLRTPTDFDRVYRLPTVTGPELFARIDRGLTAVFQRSDYRPSGASVPAGTTWYIGPLPEGLLAPRIGAGHSDLAARSRERAVEHLRVADRPKPDRALPGEPATVATSSHPAMPWEGELHRRARVRELLHQAARTR
ncbi:MAG: hypothetical protein ACF8Q5_03965 [Phycisphaerales bacterium JB040]